MTGWDRVSESWSKATILVRFHSCRKCAGRCWKLPKGVREAKYAVRRDGQGRWFLQDMVQHMVATDHSTASPSSWTTWEGFRSGRSTHE